MTKSKPYLANEQPPIGLADDVDRTCKLILECLDVNNVSKSAGVSAMATLIANILSSYEDPDHFYNILKLMKEVFKECKKLS